MVMRISRSVIATPAPVKDDSGRGYGVDPEMRKSGCRLRGKLGCRLTGVRKGAAIASKLESVQRMSHADRVSRKTKDESRNPRKLAAHLSIDLRQIARDVLAS
jgi:hypothetical protein